VSNIESDEINRGLEEADYVDSVNDLVSEFDSSQRFSSDPINLKTPTQTQSYLTPGSTSYL
jgi:hypothetical protein